MFKYLPNEYCSKSLQLIVSALTGYVARVLCAIVLHIVDSHLSFLNKVNNVMGYSKVVSHVDPVEGENTVVDKALETGKKAASAVGSGIKKATNLAADKCEYC